MLRKMTKCGLLIFTVVNLFAQSEAEISTYYLDSLLVENELDQITAIISNQDNGITDDLRSTYINTLKLLTSATKIEPYLANAMCIQFKQQADKFTIELAGSLASDQYLHFLESTEKGNFILALKQFYLARHLKMSYSNALHTEIKTRIVELQKLVSDKNYNNAQLIAKDIEPVINSNPVFIDDRFIFNSLHHKVLTKLERNSYKIDEYQPLPWIIGFGWWSVASADKIHNNKVTIFNIRYINNTSEVALKHSQISGGYGYLFFINRRLYKKTHLELRLYDGSYKVSLVTDDDWYNNYTITTKNIQLVLKRRFDPRYFYRIKPVLGLVVDLRYYKLQSMDRYFEDFSGFGQLKFNQEPIYNLGVDLGVFIYHKPSGLVFTRISAPITWTVSDQSIHGKLLFSPNLEFGVSI